MCTKRYTSISSHVFDWLFVFTDHHSSDLRLVLDAHQGRPNWRHYAPSLESLTAESSGNHKKANDFTLALPAWEDEFDYRMPTDVSHSESE